MNKGKKRLMLFISAVVVLITAFVTIFGTSKEAHAASGTQLSTSTQAALEQKMKSKYFTHNGTTYHINQYYNQLYANNGGVTCVSMSYSSFTGNVTGSFNSTDPITSLIPVAVFEELKLTTGVYTHMGEQWGVIIDSFSDNYATF